MEMSRELIENFQFREARKGYDMREVDEFLEKLAVAFSQIQERLRDAEQRAEAAAARVAEAQRRVVEAERRAADPDRPTGTSEAEETETLRRTLVLAQRTADAAIKEAEEHAARVRAEAEEIALSTRASADEDARRSIEEARQLVVEEMAELAARRDALSNDIELLDRHLDEQRQRLQASVADLQKALDDPATLRIAVTPELSGATVPVFEPLVDEDAPADEPTSVADPTPDAPSVEADDPESMSWMTPDDEWAAPPEDAPTPASQPVDPLAQREPDDDDEYLAELRKAMTDDSPLGPREDDDAGGFFDQGDDSTSRSRFGRRR